MALLVPLLTLLTLSGSATACIVDTCRAQSPYVNIAITPSTPGVGGAPDCPGCAQYKVCLTIRGMTDKPTGITHTCVKPPNTCNAGDFNSFSSIWSIGGYGKACGANSPASNDFAQCQYATAGTYVYFLLKDGGSCRPFDGSPDYFQKIIATKNPGGANVTVNAECRSRTGWAANGEFIKSCTLFGWDDECVWKVQVPGPDCAPSPPPSQAGCVDKPDWKDCQKFNCQDYVKYGWCLPNGSPGPNWKSHWGDITRYTDDDGVDATRACCGCGSSGCQDVPGWTDANGYTCADYAKYKLCTPFGTFGSGWLFDIFKTFKSQCNKQSGLDATQACCACGRTNTSPAPSRSPAPSASSSQSPATSPARSPSPAASQSRFVSPLATASPGASSSQSPSPAASASPGSSPSPSPSPDNNDDVDPKACLAIQESAQCMAVDDKYPNKPSSFVPSCDSNKLLGALSAYRCAKEAGCDTVVCQDLIPDDELQKAYRLCQMRM